MVTYTLMMIIADNTPGRMSFSKYVDTAAGSNKSGGDDCSTPATTMGTGELLQIVRFAEAF